jgi:hypothetical protein
MIILSIVQAPAIKRVVGFGLILLTSFASGQIVESPQSQIGFNDFLVELKFHGKPAAPLHNTPFSRGFKTRIQSAAAHGPNFADHYTIAAWGCGAGCVAFSIVDAMDGRVYDFPFSVSWNDESDSGVLGRRNSRALHVVGSLNEGDNSADRWYLWTGKELKLISERPAKHLDADRKTGIRDK